MNTIPEPMSGIVLAEAVERQGKSQRLTVIRVFETEKFLEFPTSETEFVVVVWIRNLAPATVRARMTFIVIEESSSEIVREGHGVYEFGVLLGSPARTLDTVYDIDFRMKGVKFPRPGRYSVVILFDGVEIGTRPFTVEQL